MNKAGQWMTGHGKGQDRVGTSALQWNQMNHGAVLTRGVRQSASPPGPVSVSRYPRSSHTALVLTLTSPTEIPSALTRSPSCTHTTPCRYSRLRPEDKGLAEDAVEASPVLHTRSDVAARSQTRQNQ